MSAYLMRKAILVLQILAVLVVLAGQLFHHPLDQKTISILQFYNAPYYYITYM